MRAAAPAIAAYVIFLALLLSARRRAGPRTPRTLREIATTVAGGYVAFLAIVVVFAPISGTPLLPLLRAGIPQGAALAALALAFFAAANAIYGRGKRS